MNILFTLTDSKEWGFLELDGECVS